MDRLVTTWLKPGVNEIGVTSLLTDPLLTAGIRVTGLRSCGILAGKADQIEPGLLKLL